MRRLTAFVAAAAMVLTMAPVNVFAATPALTGGVRGTVIENSGRSLGNTLQAQLVDSLGNPVPGMTAAVDRDGSFAFNNVAPGIYTVQILGANGMSAVTVTAGRVANASVTVAVAPAPAPPHRAMTKKAGWITTAVVAGGALGGWAIYEATKSDASPSK